MSVSRPELARGHPLDRMKDPIERRQTLESAGAGDLGDRPPWCLTEQPAAQADALCGHGLGEALARALEQHVHVADRNPKQVGDHRRREARLRQKARDRPARQRQPGRAQCPSSASASCRDHAALDQRQLRQRIDQRRGSRRVTILHRLLEVGEAGFHEGGPSAIA